MIEYTGQKSYIDDKFIYICTEAEFTEIGKFIELETLDMNIGEKKIIFKSSISFDRIKKIATDKKLDRII
jgi:hypothetical protein